jgi:phosphatidylethanolamine/phosphatidyl-N-methylethanolamine N-methyltransferase
LHPSRELERRLSVANLRNRQRMKMAAYLEFLRGLIRDPQAVSAPTPSSAALADAIASKVDPLRPGLVLELGPGTGVVTHALVRRGIAPERLVLIEYGSFFLPLLKAAFPKATIMQGDAFEFERHLPRHTPIAAVVSGIPLLNFAPARRRALIQRALATQAPGGRFIQLSYGWRPPIENLNGIRPSKTLVWRNLPPAHVWTYEARAEVAQAKKAAAQTSGGGDRKPQLAGGYARREMPQAADYRP